MGSHLLCLGWLGDLAAWVSGEGPREVTIRRGRARSHRSDPWPFSRGWQPGSAPLSHARVDGEHSMQLHARVDAELREDLAQVVLDGAGADEKPGADLGVGQALAGELGDLGLLRRELAAGVDGSLARGLAGGQQLASGALGETFGPHRDEHPVGGAQVFAGVGSPALAAEPLTVEEVGAGQRPAHAGAGEPGDRLAVEAVGALAVA